MKKYKVTTSYIFEVVDDASLNEIADKMFTGHIARDALVEMHIEPIEYPRTAD